MHRLSGIVALVCATGAFVAHTANAQIVGRVLGAGAPISGSTVTLWVPSDTAPRQIAETKSDADGRFDFGADALRQVSGVSFPVRVDKVGLHSLTVTALGTSASDAVARSVQVLPDGKLVSDTSSGVLADSSTASHTFAFPAGAVAGSQQMYVEVYPAFLAHVVNGMESLLRQPSGCSPGVSTRCTLRPAARTTLVKAASSASSPASALMPPARSTCSRRTSIVLP